MRVFMRLMAVPALFLTIGALSVAIDFSTVRDGFLIAVPFSGAYAGVNQFSLRTAILLFWKAIGAAACMYYLSLTTPAADLLTLLYDLGIPRLVVELTGLVYRFIFMLLETAEVMLAAQGSRLGYSSIASSYRSLGLLASALFTSSLRKSEQLYTGLEARGYDGKLSVMGDEYETSWKDFVPALLLNLFLVIISSLLGKYTGGMLNG